MAEAQAILDACEHLRDRFLLAVLWDAGRIGEALGLRHEDIAAAERSVTIVPRVNDNRARSKSRQQRTIPVSDAFWLGCKLHITETCDDPPPCTCRPDPAATPCWCYLAFLRAGLAVNRAGLRTWRALRALRARWFARRLSSIRLTCLFLRSQAEMYWDCDPLER